MSLKKEMYVGETLEFDYNAAPDDVDKILEMKDTETIGRKVILNITADRSILVRHFKQPRVKGQPS